MNILDLLRKIGRPATPPSVSVSAVKTTEYTPEQESLIKACGASLQDIQKLLQQQSEIAYDRYSLATLYTSIVSDPIVSGALGVYAETAVSVSPNTGRSMWVTSKDAEVQKELIAFLDAINIEERLYDWAQTIAQYGDLFVEVNGQPGVGVVSIEDTTHAIEWGRIDANGRLIGFFRTPNSFLQHDSSMTSHKTKLLPPWALVHFRNLAGYKRRLPMDANTNSYSTNFSMGGPTIEGSATYGSRYGTSILFDCLLPFKRYRLAADSLMLCRLSKGTKRYIFKLAIPEKTSNPQMVASLVDEVKRLLARSTTMDTRAGSSTFADRKDAPSAYQDILIPVFGDANNLQVDTLGTEVDIKWIADIDDLRAQLATALKVPLSLLAGYSDQGPNDWGGKGLENVDIRFARSVRRLQKTLIHGVTRLCQIHLAFLGKDPDATKFEVSMNITSSAEEKQLQEAAKDASDTIDKMMGIIVPALGEESTDKVGLLNYFNKKFLKLGDLDLRKYILTAPIVKTANSVEVDFSKQKGAKPEGEVAAEPANDIEIPMEPDKTMPKESILPADCCAALPIDVVTVRKSLLEKTDTGEEVEKIVETKCRSNEDWLAKFGSTDIELKKAQ